MVGLRFLMDHDLNWYFLGIGWSCRTGDCQCEKDAKDHFEERLVNVGDSDFHNLRWLWMWRRWWATRIMGRFHLQRISASLRWNYIGSRKNEKVQSYINSFLISVFKSKFQCNMIHDIWYTIHDTWYMIHHIHIHIHDTCMIYDTW